MAVFETWLKSDLQKPVAVKLIPGVVFSQDNMANKVGVIVTDGGQPVTLSGTVYGYVIIPTGETVEVEGTIEDNKAYFLMPQDCYVPGHISIVIKLTSGETITTLGACTAYVYKSKTDEEVVPSGTPIPDLSVVEEAIGTYAEAAADSAEDSEAYALGTRGGTDVESTDPTYHNNSKYYAEVAETAATSASAAYGTNLLAPTYSATATYAVGDHVIYNGGYYECNTAISTAEAWNSAHWTQLTVGGETSALKSAIRLTVTEKFNFSGQIVDTRGKTTTELGYIGNDVWFNFSDGVYYTNPFTNNTGKIIYLWPRDSSDEAITLTKGSSTYQNIELSNSYLWKITVDGLTINAKGYANLTSYPDTPTFNQTYTVSSQPHHWRFKGNGYTPNGAIDRGITIDEYSTEYVEFVEPTSEYIYSKELDDHIQEFTAESEAKMEEEIAEVDAKIGDLPPLVEKTAKVRMVYSGNVVDTTGKTASGSTLDGSIHFNFSDGVYYSNPWATNTGKSIAIYPKDASGNTVYMTSRKDGQTRATYIDISSVFFLKIVVDGLDVSAYYYNSQSAVDADNFTGSYLYTLDSAPAYWEFRGSGYTQGGSIERGFTQDTYNSSYVEYVEPTKSYVYTKELNEHISGYSDAVKSMVFEPSANLLDYSKIVWVENGGYYYLERDYYMPVTAGAVIETDNTQGQFQFYDSSYTQLGTSGFSTPYYPITVPNGASWARIIFSTSFIAEGDPVMVWVAQSATSAKYERPIYRPNIKYDPQYADGSIFDYAIPQGVTQGVVRMARFASIRAANERQSAYRFATYNTYVSRGDSGFWLLREMAFDYALDFMGMQECNYPGTTAQSAMYQFQFPYGTPQMLVDESQINIPVPSVSRFEIASVKDILLKESRHCLRVTMNLPRNKHYPRVPTLSVYNYHGSLSKANRLEEIQTMLDEIAEDTSDFIIIMGDTNSEVDQQGHRQSWDMWENAGFTAVHHGESPTWPSQVNPSNYSSMDNIFVSEHINVLGYNIVPWQNYLLPGNLPLSDHDMVYADLQFDFDAVLKDTWEEPHTVT